jgi:hypothetical protein
VLVGGVLVACACGHASAPAPAARVVASGPVPDAPPPDAVPPDAAPSSSTSVNGCADAMRHVATPEGPMPGLPSMAILRLPNAAYGGGEAVITVFAPGSKDDPILVLGLASSSPAPANRDAAKAWLTSVTTRAVRAYDIYKQRADGPLGRDRVEAEARLVQLARHRVDAVIHQRPYPAIAKPSGYNQAFCDGMAKNFELDIDDADKLAATCRADAASLGITSGWILDACRAP